MNDTVISVVIAAYNRSDYLKQSLASVVSQRYRPIELIVVDDGSEEPIETVVRDVVPTNSGIDIVYCRQKNSGPGVARNTGVDVAKGNFISFLDSDDLWRPDMLSSLASQLIDNPDIDMACGGWDMIDESNKEISGVFMPSALQTKTDADFVKEIVLKSMFPIHSVMFRKTCFDTCGGFNTTLPILEDWDLWIRMAANGCRIKFIDTHVASWRIHTGIRRSDYDDVESFFSTFFDQIFSYDKIRSRLSHLRIAAEINLLITYALYFKESMQADEMNRCINRAGKLFLEMPYDEDMLVLFARNTSYFEEAKTFRQMVLQKMPVCLSRTFDTEQKWNTLKKKIKNRLWLQAFFGIMRIIISHPLWCIKKLAKISSEKFIPQPENRA